MTHLCDRISWVRSWWERWTWKTRHSINIINCLIDSIDCLVWQIESSWSWLRIWNRIGSIRVRLSTAIIIWLWLRAYNLVRHCIKNWIWRLENAWRIISSSNIYASHYIYARIRIIAAWTIALIVALIVWWAIVIIARWVLIGISSWDIQIWN